MTREIGDASDVGAARAGDLEGALTSIADVETTSVEVLDAIDTVLVEAQRDSDS